MSNSGVFERRKTKREFMLNIREISLLFLVIKYNMFLSLYVDIRLF